MHLLDAPGVALPTVEGVLVGFDRVRNEYRLGVPSLTWAAGANPDHLEEARELRIPRERVVFYEEVKA